MTLTLELPPEVEGALAAEARRKGITLERLALDRLRQSPDAEPSPALEPALRHNAMLALFAQWDAEDATDDPEELARRQRESDELMASLAANRVNFEGRTDFSGLLDMDDDPEDASPVGAA